MSQRKWWYAWEIAEQVQLHKMSDEMLTTFAAYDELKAEVERLKNDREHLLTDWETERKDLQSKLQQAEAEIERLKASRLEDIELCNSTWRSQFDKQKEEIDVLIDALKMYASLKGTAMHWPDRDYYSYLEIPAIEALAKVNKIRERK